MNAAIILSGGVGSRFGGSCPKQYIEVGGKPIIQYSLETFSQRADVDVIVVVAAEEWRELISHIVVAIRARQPVVFAAPGETRQYSIYNGLIECSSVLGGDNDLVMIHDAARPMLSNDLIDRCFDGCVDCDGVLPVLPVKDTIYTSQDGMFVTGLLVRSELSAGQAPEVFRYAKYLDCHNNTQEDVIEMITGSAEIAVRGGMKIKFTKGEEQNFKITTQDDLDHFARMVSNAG